MHGCILLGNELHSNVCASVTVKHTSLYGNEKRRKDKETFKKLHLKCGAPAYTLDHNRLWERPEVIQVKPRHPSQLRAARQKDE